MESHEPFSAPAHRMHRVVDPETSKKSASTRGAKNNLMRILEVVRSFGDDGCTQDEVFEALNFGREDETGPQSYSGITGAWAPLERQRFIECTGEERIGKRFGAKQEVRRALSEEERTARLLGDLDVVSRPLSTDDYVKIDAWYMAQQALEKAKVEEAAARDAVIRDVYRSPRPGLYTIALQYGYALTAKICESKTYLSWKQIKPRRP